MADSRLPLIQGTLVLVILKALTAGPRHGYAVSQWIKTVTNGALLVEEGSLYPALRRIERKGWVESRWAISDTGRRARFYELSDAGRERLERELETWRLYVAAIERAVSASESEVV